jgi:DNA helicase-2/ATP-dependent DNA helicase PcrA
MESPDAVAGAAGYNRRDEHIAKVYAFYLNALKESSALDFDDLLLKTVELFESSERVRTKYSTQFKFVMVDEYQDTNRPQYLLITRLAGKHRNLCVVGDPDQSIYKWRGADLRNILDFEQDFGEAKIVKLERNYRSTQIILDAELMKHLFPISRASLKPMTGRQFCLIIKAMVEPIRRADDRL